MSYVHRDSEKIIKQFLKRKEFLALIGPRQVGKTTLLKHIAGELKKSGKSVEYLTFETRSDLAFFNDIENFKEFYKKKDVVIIDEFQYAADGGQKLKYLFDTGKTKYIVSGSSSLELKFQMSKFMVGRLIKFTLWPFSFREYLLQKDPDVHDLLSAKIKSLDSFDPKKAFGLELHRRLEKYFEEYLIFGGYPAVVLSKIPTEKEIILKNLLEDYLLKDVRSLLHLATEDKLINLMKLLAVQTGNLINYAELSISCGLNYSRLIQHMEILKQTYIIDLLRPYFGNKRTEIKKNPKIFFIDAGFRNMLLADVRKFDQRENVGSLVENYVYSMIVRQNKYVQNVNFWRTRSGAEVDFVVSVDGGIIPIEVKYSKNPSVGKSIYSFIEKFSPKKFFILTNGYSNMIKIKKTKIIFMPVYYFDFL